MEEYVAHPDVKKAWHLDENAAFFMSDNGVGFNYNLTEKSLLGFYEDLAVGKWAGEEIKVLVYNGERAKRASEICTDIMAASTTELTHSICLARFIRFALASLKMHLASLRSVQVTRTQESTRSWRRTGRAVWGWRR
mgnify:CR=1 FL=1